MALSEVKDWCTKAKFVGYSPSDQPLYECSLHELRVTIESSLCEECGHKKVSKAAKKDSDKPKPSKKASTKPVKKA